MNQQIWTKNPYVSISYVDGSEMQFRARTSNINVSGGNFNIEGIETFGGKVTQVGTREDVEVSMDIFPVSAESSDYDALFHGHTGGTATISSWDEKKVRLCVLWTDESGVTSGAQAISSGSDGYRHIYAEGYITDMETSQDADEELTGTMTFKTTVEDETGGSNVKKESCTEGGTPVTLGSVPSYTSTTKF